MAKKEISNFSYSLLSILGGAGMLFSLLSPNGSVGGAAVSGLFAVLGIGGIVRNRRRAAAQPDNETKS